VSYAATRTNRAEERRKIKLDETGGMGVAYPIEDFLDAVAGRRPQEARRTAVTAEPVMSNGVLILIGLFTAVRVAVYLWAIAATCRKRIAMLDRPD
jgi:hypothetical protein